MIIELKWEVIKWKQLWNTIWFPTANIFLWKNILEDWTYKINIIIDSKIYAWAGSALNEKNIFESYIFDFNQNIYWKEIEVIVLEKIRDNKKFENIWDLINQIKQDVKLIKSKNNYVLTFWSYDLVHEWHKSHLEQSKKYWDILVTILATDKNIEKFKWKKPLYKIEERINHLKDLWVSDIISSWDEENPMKWIDMYMPNVICLWYDQVWFSNQLQDYIKENNLKIEIKRTKAYKENEFKSSKIKEKLTS
jgi:FAD synthase